MTSPIAKIAQVLDDFRNKSRRLAALIAHANGDTDRPRLDRAGTRHLQTLWTLGAVGGMTDADLLARFVAGTKHPDETDAAELAFAALVHRHGGIVLRVARTVLGDESASLDASQATFLLLAQKAWRLHVDDSLAPWLASVAHRVALGVRKAEARRRRHESAAARPESTSGPRPEIWSETIRAVLAEVDRLPETYRAAVVACHLDGLTQQAAADRLGWPLGTLQSRLDRGRRRLRDRLTRRGLAPSTLGLIPSSGLPTIFPSHLTPPLARAAVAWALKASPSALPLAPGVVAILHPTLKGTIVLKLTAAAFTLTTALGIAATGFGPRFGIGGDIPGPVPALAAGKGSSPATIPPVPAPAPRVEDVSDSKHTAFPDLLAPPTPTPASRVMTSDPVIPAPSPLADSPPVSSLGVVVPPPDDTPKIHAPKAITPPIEEPIPPAVKGPDLTNLLCFVLNEVGDPILPPPGKALELDKLTKLGYPVRRLSLTSEFDRGIARKYQVAEIPTFLIVDGIGHQEVQMRNVFLSTRELAQRYNAYQEESIRKTQDSAANSVPPAPKPPDLSVLCFTAEWSGPCQEMKPQMAQLAANGFPIDFIDIDKQPEIAGKYDVWAVPTCVLINANRAEVARTSGVTSARDLANVFNQAKQQAAAERSPSDSTKEPSLANPKSIPRPWKTVVRLKNKLTSQEWGFGSGIVIASTARATYVLTVAHLLRDKNGRDFSSEQPIPNLTVDLFGENFVSKQPARLACAERELPAELIAISHENNFALVRIQPGRVLPVSPIAPSTFHVVRGMRLLTTGCAHGEDATAWDTKVLDPSFRMNGLKSEKQTDYSVIKCQYQPTEGRSGGGLFTTDGYLVGVCNFADPNEHVGLYRGTDFLPKLAGSLMRGANGTNLDLVQLQIDIPDTIVLPLQPSTSRRSSVQEEELAGSGALGDRDLTATAQPQATQPPANQRLDDLERKLDRIIEGMRQNDPMPVPRNAPIVQEDSGPPADSGVPRASIRSAEPSVVPPPSAGLSRRGGIREETAIDGAGVERRVFAPASPSLELTPPISSRRASSPNLPEPTLTPPVSNQERRLRDLEQKLDRVLESLDNIRGQSSPFRTHGGLGP